MNAEIFTDLTNLFEDDATIVRNNGQDSCIVLAGTTLNREKKVLSELTKARSLRLIKRWNAEDDQAYFILVAIKDQTEEI